MATKNGDQLPQGMDQPLGARPATPDEVSRDKQLQRDYGDGRTKESRPKQDKKKYTVLSQNAIFGSKRHDMGAVVELTEEEARRHTDGGVRLRAVGEDRDAHKQDRDMPNPTQGKPRA